MIARDSLSQNREGHIPLDPRTKFSLMLIISTICLGSGGGDMFHVIRLFLSAIPFILMLLSGKTKSLFKCILTFSIAYLSMILLMPLTSGIVGFLILASTGLVIRIMPCVAMGYYLVSTTTVSEFIAAAHRLKLSDKIVIPMSVMFRFFPTIREEYHDINNAMRMRGISAIRRPMEMLEYRIVPLMMSILKIGDELSAAALTRGLDSPEQRTNICQIGLNAYDAVLLSVTAACLILYILNLGGLL